MRRKGRPKKQKSGKSAGRRPGRPRKRANHYDEEEAPKPSVSRKARKKEQEPEEPLVPKKEKGIVSSTVLVVDDGMSEGLHVTTSQVHALGSLVCCRECGESVRIGVRPTTKGMISEFTVACLVCEDTKSTNTPNLVRERKRKREKKDAVLQKTENINYAHVAAFLDNGLGYSGLRHYCKYFNARCLNEATFIVYARQVISDVVADTEESLQYSASIVREVFKSQLETDGLVDLTVSFTTTYHQWGSDFCLVAGAVIELTTGLVLDYDVANMYCHVCKINAKKIVSMSPTEMTEWFNKHQDTCEIREWCDELDHDAEEGVREIEPKYLECFIAKKIWSRSIDKFGFRYTTLIHESDEKIHEELSNAGVYGDVPILIDSATSCFSRRKSEHARTSFQTKLKAKCPRERVQTKDRIMYVYSMSIPEYNRFAISSNIKLRQLVKEMEGGEEGAVPAIMEEEEGEEQMPNALQLHEVKAIKRLVANGEEEEEEDEEERVEREILLEEEEVNREEREVDEPEELEEGEGMEQDDEDLLKEEEALAAQQEEEERRKLEAEWGEDEEEEEEEEAIQEIAEEGEVERQIEEIHLPLHIKQESKPPIKEEVLGLAHQLEEEVEEDEEEEEGEQQQQEEDEELEGIEEEEEEEIEELQLEDEDEEMDDREEEEELQVEDQVQEEEKEEAEVPPQPQPTSKQTKKQEDDKTKTSEKSEGVLANQRSQTGELKQTRKEEIKKNQQEEISKKRKQEDMEEDEDVVVKRSKQEESKQNSKEVSKPGETKQKNSERGQCEKEDKKQASVKEDSSKEQEDKAKTNDKQKQKEDKPKEKEQQKSDNQQPAKREDKQKADTKPSEKKEDKPKSDTKLTENKDNRQKTDTKPTDKRADRPKPDTKPSEKKDDKKVSETKAQEKEEIKEKEKDVTKQKEEESKPRTEVKQKGDVNQQEKADTSKQPPKKSGEGEGKAGDTRPKVTSNATVTEKA